MPEVTELRPRLPDWSKLIAAFRRGSYSACLADLRTPCSAAARSLKARALFRLGRFSEAAKEVSLCTDNEAMATRGEHASLLSSAAISLGRFEDARDAQRDARAYLYSVDEPVLTAELGVFEARLAFANSDVSGTKRLVERSIEALALVSNRYDLIEAAIHRCDVRSELANVLGVVEMSASNYEAASYQFRSGLSLCGESDNPDIGLKAKLLSNLSATFEQSDVDYDTVAVGFVRRTNASMPWTVELADFHTLVLRELGWASALAGDNLTAFREFKASYHAASTDAKRLRASLDRVYLSRQLNQHLLAHADLLEAYDLSTSIDWTSVPDIDAACLPTLATLLAQIDLDAARSALKQYALVRKYALRSSSLFVDQRFAAELLVAQASIARAEGHTSISDALLAEAFDLFERLGLGWLAAQVALDMTAYQMPKFRDRLWNEARRRPNSWIAAKVASA